MKKIVQERNAVAGVIEALLLVALIAIIISMIQLQYIPQIMEQREADHMDQVANQFAYLKSLIDIQAVAGSMGTGTPLASAPMNAQLTLGSGQLPYFITAPAVGQIQVENDSQSFITIGPYPLYEEKTQHPKDKFWLACIEYDADNSYFVDQTYILEGGGIILSQPHGKPVMRADPCISFTNNSNNSITVRFYLPIIIGYAGKNMTSGTGSCFVRTTYANSTTYATRPGDWSNITIQSRYADAWNESLHRAFSPVKNYVQVAHIPGTNTVQITSSAPRIQPINLVLTIVVIQCEIGPGWVI